MCADGVTRRTTGSSATRYRSMTADSARWEGFTFRDGDIIISAPIKCGTTWTQMICALLIFQQRTFPMPLDIISPWLEMLTRPLTEVVSDLDAQRHRRFIKSHTPLDGLPFRKQVTYVCIGRDPRDAALSLNSHMANMNMSALLFALRGTGALDNFGELAPVGRPAPSMSVRERFWQWVDAPASPGLRTMVHHLKTFWEARECSNVVLLHYDDLKADLEGQMRRLAARLGVTIPEELWLDLVKAATFQEMRKHADDIVPNSTESVWHDNARFFNKGTSGQWRELLDEEELRRYQSRIMELADPDLVVWLHQGSADLTCVHEITSQSRTVE
jgi:aryl sulfotransferase